MKPLAIEMVELLLKKRETIKMTTSFQGNVVDCVLCRAVRYTTTASLRADGYIFVCKFYDDIADENWQVEERRTDDEVELMTLKKYGQSWHLF